MDTRSMKHFVGAVNPGRYFKSAFWLTASRILSMLVSLAATFYVARTLGPQNFGELSYAQSVVGILALFSALVGALYRDLVKYQDRENQLLGTAWVIAFTAAFATSALALAYVLIVPHSQLTIMVIALICLGQFFSPFSIISNVFYAKTETKWLSLANLLTHTSISVLKIAAMLAGQGVLILALIMVIEQLLMAVTYLILYVWKHHGHPWRWRFDTPYAKKLILDSLPIMVITASGVVSGRIDQIFIKHYLDTAMVGLYGVAVQLSEVWQFIPGLLMTAVFPAIVNAKLTPHIYKKRLLSFGSLLLLYSLSVSTALFIAAPFIVETIYGQAFAESVYLLRIYCWSIIGMVLGFLVSNFLLNENLRKIQLVTGLLPMLFNIFLNILLIPFMGAAGAALATVVTYTLAPVIPLFYKSVRLILFSKHHG